MFKIAITEKTLQSYLDKLPIAYYLGEKLEVKVSPNDGTFIDLLSRTIYVSSSIFNNILLEKEPTEKELENLIRNALYHEVSHAMLTPLSLHDAANQIINYDIVNIFEDQRIETILKDYYRRVDFPNFVKLVNNYKPNLKPHNAQELFYQVVRFNELNTEIEEFIEKEKNDIHTNNRYRYLPYDTGHDIYRESYIGLLEEKDKIINLYNDINMFSRFNSMVSYVNSINGLYLKCKQVMEDFSKQSKPNEDKKEEKEEEIEEKNTSNTLIKNENREKENGKNNNQENSNDNEEEEIKETLIIVKPQEEEETPESEKIEEEKEEELEPGTGGNINGEPSSVHIFKSELNKELNRTNNSFYEKLRNTIKIYKSKNKHMGGGCQAYSGRLDPRLYVRDNNESYKWFYHSNGNQLKKGCKLHLNIFCDTSGSFERNENKVNCMLKELEKVEQEMRDIFEFDVYEVDYSMRKLPKNKRRIKVTSGGTMLSKEWNKIIGKAQDINNDTLNISLFDGQIWYGRENQSLISMFNKDNFINIIEQSNASAFKRTCKQARKNIIVNGYNYSGYLEENIIKVLHSYIQGR